MLGVKMVCANLEGANLKGANFEVMNFYWVYLCILHTALFEEILFLLLICEFFIQPSLSKSSLILLRVSLLFHRILLAAEPIWKV